MRGETASTWPDWIRNLDPDIAASLDSVTAVHGRLKASVAEGYTYRHPLQAQFNATTDQMIQEGLIVQAGKSYALDKSKFKLKAASPSFVVSVMYQNGTAHRVLGTAMFSSRLAVTKLLDALFATIQHGDLLAPLVCLRGMIEHIAHFHSVVAKLRSYSVPTSSEEANKTLVELSAFLQKAGYATRINWKALLEEPDEAELDKDKLKYQREPHRADREAKSIMTEIDSLSKSVHGTRQVYEVLCEFAHPNVGGLLAFTESIEPFSDLHGVRWIEKRLSADAPLRFLQDMAPVMRRLFQQLDRCLLHFESLLQEGAAERQKVLEITQVVIRNLAAGQRDVISEFAHCPCGSERELRHCCGPQSATPVAGQESGE